MSDRIARIEQQLREKLTPQKLQVQDDSHQHLGHAGAATGLGHFTLIISAKTLQNKSRIEQHRIIYEALGDLMQTDIHALKIQIED